MSSNNAQATLDNLATLLFAMQQIVLADAQQNGNVPNPEKVYGKVIAAHWAAIRQSVGLAGKWATLDETKAALRATVAGGGAVAVPMQGLSATMDFDMSEFDPASTMCTTCGTAGGRGPSGECLICGGM